MQSVENKYNKSCKSAVKFEASVGQQETLRNHR